MNTFGSFFSGGGGMDIGAAAAGWQLVFANEYQDDIAAVYVANLGNHMVSGDLLGLDVRTLPRVRWFHASPPCPNFSNAKTNAEETANDLRLARQVAAYIIHHLPDFVTIENVYGYRKSKSWRIIARAFYEHGYQFNYWHVCMADYAVPQTRRRMIALARRDGVTPQLPPATHTEFPKVDLFGDGLPGWIGWYAAIEDLIPMLPDSEFAPWQLEKLPSVLTATSLINHKDTIKEATVLDKNRPSMTITVSLASRPSHMSAFIMDSANPNSTGRVVQMTLRALARFQSFPDWYQLPDSRALACRIIGNAVPALFAQRLGEWLK